MVFVKIRDNESIEEALRRFKLQFSTRLEGSVDASGAANIVGETLTPWAVAHSSSSTRLKRYCPLTRCPGSPWSRIHR